MLQTNIDEMKQTVLKLVSYRNPPRYVGIKQEHAEHLGLSYKNKMVLEQDRYALPSQRDVIVNVDLGELVVSLKGAIGSDKELSTEGQTDSE